MYAILHVCMYVGEYDCICICIHVFKLYLYYMYMYVYMYIRAYVNMYAFILCRYVRIYIGM